MRLVLLLAALALAACASTEPPSRARENVVAGPEASPELIAAISANDRLLFDIVFSTCDLEALDGLIAADFRMMHDKHGVTASDRDAFIASIRQGCEARASGENIQASRELNETHMHAVQGGQWAIQTGVHSFYGLDPGRPPVLRERAQFFHVWHFENGAWRLTEVYSYDHRAA